MQKSTLWIFNLGMFQNFADIDHAKNKLNYEPGFPIQKGIPKFIEWYKSYHKIACKLEDFHAQVNI